MILSSFDEIGEWAFYQFHRTLSIPAKPNAADSFSGAGTPFPWGSNATTTGGQAWSYLNNTTTFTEEAGKKRVQTSDGLARLITVNEDPSVLNYTTSYTYDFGDRLTGVGQTDSVEGAQTRTFTYDSAGRLKTAVNPEIGTVSYQYDNNGNMTQRSDSRITANLGYDHDNRVTSKSYSGTTPATPTVTYCYDALPTSPGTCATSFTAGSGFVDRETEVYSSASRTDYLLFDSFGRVKTSQQVTGSVAPGTFSYTYTPQTLATVTYPSGRKITYSFDSTAGRVTTVADASNTYGTSITYWANGAIEQMKLGNNLVEQTCLNSRMEPLAIRLGTTSGTTNCANSSDTLNLAYTYASSDNGNVLSQAINRSGTYAPNSSTYSFSATHNYNATTPYDGVNRLKSFSETGPGSGPTENYSYDAFGNRWVTSPAPPTVETPVAQTWYTNGTASSGCGTPWRPNQINGWCYDGSGNVASVGGMQRAFTYDAENRQVTAAINGSTSSYVYDGDGRRVQSTTPSGTTTYVYDAMGQLAAEYSSITPKESGTIYVTGDHLGSTRVATDASGNTVECLDYYPFGAEIGASVDSRPACYSSGMYPASPDVLSEKFTGKERDAETGLDHSWFRYSSAAQGRWTSPDPFGGSISDPQTLNRYAYVRNNPLGLIDPLGLNQYCSADENGKITCGDTQDLPTTPGSTTTVDLLGGTTPEQAASNQTTLTPTAVPSSNDANDVPLGTFAQQAFSQTGRNLQHFNDFMVTFAAGSVVAGAAIAAAPAAATAIAQGAARTVGWAYGATGGTGVVLGSYLQYPNYIDAARSLGANVFNVRPWIWSALNLTGQTWTANRAFLDASIARGQQFYLSTAPLGASGYFATELEYLTSRGVGPNQWLMVPLSF